jgi:hypothetical protein
MLDRKLFAFAVLALSATPALAQVPYTFSPNTEAKASEVNANFDYLATRGVFVKSGLDCPTTLDANNNPYCVLKSDGSLTWNPNAPFTTVTTLALPEGQYLVTGKVQFYTGRDYRNAWVNVECELVDGAQAFLDWSNTEHVSWVEGNATTAGGWFWSQTKSASPIVLQAPLAVTGGPGQVSVICRVQGNELTGTGATPTNGPIDDIRLTNVVRITALQVGSIQVK